MTRWCRAAFVLGALGAALAGCSSNDKCQFVDCVPPATCDPKDGLCKGGSDAGSMDAGSACGTCPATAPVCNTANNTCVVCTATLGCNAITPVCNLAAGPQGQCVQCLTSTDCPPLTPTCTAANTCVAGDGGAPGNVSCATAQALDVSTGSANVQGTTSGASVLFKVGDVSPTCSASALTYGQTVVYSMQLSGAHDVIATATPTGASTLQPVLYLRDANCTSGLAADELACAAPLSQPPFVAVPALDAGASSTYYLFVSGAAGSAGDFDLQVNVDPPSARPADTTCAAATLLGAFTATNTQATVSGSTFDVVPVDSTDCNDDEEPTARTVYYKFTTSSVGRIDATVTAGDGGYGYVPLVYVTDSTCAAGSSSVGCAPVNPGDPASIELDGLVAGTYWVGVSGIGGTAGPFTLQMQFTPPPGNDVCPGQVLTFSGGTATAQGDTSIAAAAARNATCAGVQSDQGFDLVYQFALATAQDVLVDVQANAGSNLLPMIFVGPALQCTADGTGAPCGFTQTHDSSLFLPNQPAGSYFLWVDTGTHGYDFSGGSGIGNPGSFTATVQLSAPSTAANVACPGAALTLPASGVAGTNVGSTETFADSCMVPGNSGTDAPSVAYHITVPSKQQLTVTVTPSASAPLLQPGIFLGNALCAPTGLGCSAAAEPGLPAQLLIPEVPAGTYTLVVTGIDTVDAQNGAVGSFTLDASLDPVQGPPENVSCADAGSLAFSPTAVGFSATAQGTTIDAGAHTTFSCASAADTNPSVVYSFTTPADGQDGGLAVRVSATSFDNPETSPVVTVRAICSDESITAQLACAPAVLPELASTVALNLRQGSTYSVWVGATDGGTTGSGPFALEVDLAPIPAPNDNCANPASLDANTTALGTTLGAADDFNNQGANQWYSQTDAGSACSNIQNSNAENGADVVFSYVATATGLATVIVTPEPSLAADVAVLEACKPGACIASTTSTGAGTPVISTFSAVQGRTYFFAVDSNIAAVPAASLGRGAFGIGVWQ